MRWNLDNFRFRSFIIKIIKGLWRLTTNKMELKKKRFPFYYQLFETDCGPACLRMISAYYGRQYSARFLRDITKVTSVGASLFTISNAAKELGFKSKVVKLPVEALRSAVTLPCILHWQRKHFVVLYKITKSRNRLSRSDNKGDVLFNYFYHIADPSVGRLKLNEEDMINRWLLQDHSPSSAYSESNNGIALLFEPNPILVEKATDNADQYDFSHLISTLLGFKKLFGQLLLGTLLGSVILLAFPFLTKSLVDVGIGYRDLNFIEIVVVGQIGLTVCSVIIEVLRSKILVILSHRLSLVILIDFFSKLLRLPISFFESRQSGDILQRLEDSERIESFLTIDLPMFFFSFVTLILFGGVLFFYDTTIFVMALVSTLLYLLWILNFFARRRELDFSRFIIHAEDQNNVIEMIQGMQDIKTLGSEVESRKRWERSRAQMYQWSVRYVSLTQFEAGISALLNQSKGVLITLVAAQKVLNNDLTLGDLVSIQYILSQINSPVQQLMGFLHSFQHAKISLERLAELQSIEDEEGPELSRSSELIESFSAIHVKNLSFSYQESRGLILKEVDLSIKKGQVVAIVGASGSGKTTLSKILMMYYRNYIGKIFIDVDEPGGLRTIDFEKISPNAWRGLCSSVFQESYIFSYSIAQNVSGGAATVDIERLWESLRLAALDEFVLSLPNGINTKVGQLTSGLSTGQRQRLLIARALYRQPKLIVFDEATNALDSVNENIIVKNITTRLDATILIVAHRLSTIKSADKIVVFREGSIVESGTHLELTKQDGSYYNELLKNQLDSRP